MISPEERTPLVAQLLELIAELQERNGQLEEEIRRLRRAFNAQFTQNGASPKGEFIQPNISAYETSVLNPAKLCNLN